MITATAKSKFLASAALIASIFVFTITAFANEAEHAAAHPVASHHGGPGDLIPYWVHFLVYAAGLYFFLLRKGVPQAFAARRNNIQNLVEKGRAELNEAKALLAQAEKNISGVQVEVSKISEQIAADGVRESALIEEDSKKRAQKILTQAKELADAERKLALTSIQRDVAAQIMQQTRTRLKAEINAANDAPLRESALAGVKRLV